MPNPERPRRHTTLCHVIMCSFPFTRQKWSWVSIEISKTLYKPSVKFRRTHGKTKTTARRVITAPRVIEQDAPPTLDTTGCGPVGQANAALIPFGSLPVEPSDGRSEVGSSDPVKPVLRGVDHFHFVPLLGLIGERGPRNRHRSSAFLSTPQRQLPG
jgi:hypothetical protein